MDLALAPETLARWQFGITTVYHFLFVPLTISLAALTAGLETAWVRTGKEKYLRATKFWGKLFLINIAMGVVTGIVQEFQFGMNWSDYSRFVGDVFGAPLAFETLIAFFFESTFIGLWIFGWDKLPKKIHLACIWMVSLGTLLSAYFILAANSWMQHPVGYRINEEKGRAELTDFWLVLTQNTTLNQVFHSFSASALTGGAFMVGIAAFHLMRKKHISVMRTSLRLGLVTMAVGGMFTAISGDTLGKVMYEQQPMKMAAAEALWDGESPAPFSVFAYGDVDKGHNEVALEIPGLLSFLAHGDFDSYVPGINDTNEALQEKFGPGDYKPIVPVAYWGFRWMIGFGMASFSLALLGLLADEEEVPAAGRPAHRGGRGTASGAAEEAAGREAHPAVLAPGALDHGVPADRQCLGLDLHRDGAAALGRLRRVADPARGFPWSVPGRGHHLDDRFHPAVRRSGRGGGQAARQVRQGGPARAHRGRSQPAHEDRWRSP
ncbi:hypothetical protein SHIRM173S_00659 [Streptomyces hirsutus]